MQNLLGSKKQASNCQELKLNQVTVNEAYLISNNRYQKLDDRIQNIRRKIVSLKEENKIKYGTKVHRNQSTDKYFLNKAHKTNLNKILFEKACRKVQQNSKLEIFQEKESQLPKVRQSVNNHNQKIYGDHKKRKRINSIKKNKNPSSDKENQMRLAIKNTDEERYLMVKSKKVDINEPYQSTKPSQYRRQKTMPLIFKQNNIQKSLTRIFSSVINDTIPEKRSDLITIKQCKSSSRNTLQLLTLKQNSNRKPDDTQTPLKSRKILVNNMEPGNLQVKESNLQTNPLKKQLIYQKNDRPPLKIKNKLQLQLSKPKLNTLFSDLVNYANGVRVHEVANKKKQRYKFLIKKGNNDGLVRRIMKKRGWFQTTNLQQADLIWSQKKQAKVFKMLTNLEIIAEKQERFYLKKLPQTPKNRVLTELQQKKLNHQQLIMEFNPTIIHNHFINNHQIAYKKLLYENLYHYYVSRNLDPFIKIPKTYHITDIASSQWNNFKEDFELDRVWIVKPGENTNRGSGIRVYSNVHQIRDHIISHKENKQQMTFIIQKYIKPYLYHNRKFDLRCFLLVTIVGDSLRAYWYQDGYARTSSKAFTLANLTNKYIHLTNDAIQSKCDDYGKFEPCNKVSFKNLSEYMHQQNSISFYEKVYPQLIETSRQVIEASFQKIHSSNLNFCFQIFGLDFMIDQNAHPWLIQVNRNPSLSTPCHLQETIISQMLDNSFAIAVDPLYPNPERLTTQNISLSTNKFKCIFNTNKISSQYHSTTEKAEIHQLIV